MNKTKKISNQHDSTFISVKFKLFFLMYMWHGYNMLPSRFPLLLPHELPKQRQRKVVATSRQEKVLWSSADSNLCTNSMALMHLVGESCWFAYEPSAHRSAWPSFQKLAQVHLSWEDTWQPTIGSTQHISIFPTLAQTSSNSARLVGTVGAGEVLCE